MTSKQVADDNEVMSNTMYKLLKKYSAVRSIIKTLHVSFDLRSVNIGKGCENVIKDGQSHTLMLLSNEQLA